MGPDLQLRRHLYERVAATSGRRRRAFRRQIGVLTGGGPEGDGGPAGVREPRRPAPGSGPTVADVPRG